MKKKVYSKNKDNNGIEDKQSGKEEHEDSGMQLEEEQEVYVNDQLTTSKEEPLQGEKV